MSTVHFLIKLFILVYEKNYVFTTVCKLWTYLFKILFNFFNGIGEGKEKKNKNRRWECCKNQWDFYLKPLWHSKRAKVANCLSYHNSYWVLLVLLVSPKTELQGIYNDVRKSVLLMIHISILVEKGWWGSSCKPWCPGLEWRFRHYP